MVASGLAAETLRSYGDVLRVGCLMVNGREVFWETTGSTEGQLQSFCEVLDSTLKAIPQLRNMDEAVLARLPHLICKSLSINYAMSEVLALLRQKLNDPKGIMCSVRTCNDSGRSLVDYGVEITPGSMLRARLSWKEQGNIISCNRSAARKVRGTLYHVETEFPMNLNCEFRPIYRLHADVACTRATERARRMANNMANTLRRRKGAVASMDTVCPDTPLAFDDMSDDKSTTSTGSTVTGCTGSGTFSGSGCSSRQEEELVAVAEDSDADVPSCGAIFACTMKGSEVKRPTTRAKSSFFPVTIFACRSK